MTPLYQLKTSDDLDIQAGFEMDKLTKKTMKELGLKCFRSTKTRSGDKIKAKRYDNVPNREQYDVHHMYNGLVGLIPKSIHAHVSHKGYYFRLAHDFL